MTTPFQYDSNCFNLLSDYFRSRLGGHHASALLFRPKVWQEWLTGFTLKDDDHDDDDHADNDAEDVQHPDFRVPRAIRSL